MAHVASEFEAPWWRNINIDVDAVHAQSAKLWDPKSGKCVATVHGHKNTVGCVKWNNNGNWLLTGSRDQTCKARHLFLNKKMTS
eukprot:8294678-Pyramimonas_sp.AAC.3